MRRFFVSRFAWGLVVGVAVCLCPVRADANHQDLTSGFDPDAVSRATAVFRNFDSGGGSSEVMVSGGSGGTANGDVDWSYPVPITFEYKGSTGELLAAVDGVVIATKNAGPLDTLNYLRIRIAKHNQTTAIHLNGVSLNGHALAVGGQPANLSVTSGEAFVNWSLGGLDLTGGFTLAGQLNVIGLGGGVGANTVQFDVGFVDPPPPPPPTDTEGPITSDVGVEPKPVLLNGSATVTATVDDATTGNTPIQSAHYKLDGSGAFVAMSTTSGPFGVDVEVNVEAIFTATDIGPHQVCVHGTDALSNAGKPCCEDFLVTYDFDGFFSPVETDDVNMAKAGQAVPVKWRLTDAEGLPISDPASFVGLYSYPIAHGYCGVGEGNPLLPEEEAAAGSSGLQYLEDGYWQFNWKTPKTYAGTCRAMYVKFNSTAISPVVKFQFKK